MITYIHFPTHMSDIIVLEVKHSGGNNNMLLYFCPTEFQQPALYTHTVHITAYVSKLQKSPTHISINHNITSMSEYLRHIDKLKERIK